MINCEKFSESVRLDIFKEFWEMSWIAKKIFVSYLVDKKSTERKTAGKADTRRGITKIYYLKLNNNKMRVCMKTFLGTLCIKEWTVRTGHLGDNFNIDTTTNLKILNYLAIR